MKQIIRYVIISIIWILGAGFNMLVQAQIKIKSAQAQIKYDADAIKTVHNICEDILMGMYNGQYSRRDVADCTTLGIKKLKTGKPHQFAERYVALLTDYFPSEKYATAEKKEAISQFAVFYAGMWASATIIGITPSLPFFLEGMNYIIYDE